jgi:hypothetical protein
MGLTADEVASTGGLTVAYIKTGPEQYKIGVTRCRPDERYMRNKGRSFSKLELIGEGENMHSLFLSEGANFQTELVEILTNMRRYRRNLTPVAKGNYTNE